MSANCLTTPTHQGLPESIKTSPVHNHIPPFSHSSHSLIINHHHINTTMPSNTRPRSQTADIYFHPTSSWTSLDSPTLPRAAYTRPSRRTPGGLSSRVSRFDDDWEYHSYAPMQYGSGNNTVGCGSAWTNSRRGGGDRRAGGGGERSRGDSRGRRGSWHGYSEREYRMADVQGYSAGAPGGEWEEVSLGGRRGSLGNRDCCCCVVM